MKKNKSIRARVLELAIELILRKAKSLKHYEAAASAGLSFALNNVKRMQELEGAAAVLTEMLAELE